jgi:uncharacterized protein YndB with AHSA1/START domain
LIAMTDLTIDREIVIDAPADVVWRTITEPDQIVQWFADRVELDARPGTAGALVFDEHASAAEAVTAAIAVEAVEPPHRFAFRWGHKQGDTATTVNSVLVEFTVVPEATDRTRLRVVETGVDTTAWPDDEKAEYVEDHRNGWEYHFGRLGDLFGRRAG